MKGLEAIFWDFDGVIIDSNQVRTNGFREVLKDYPKDQVEQLIAYHEANGGLSRYVKFNYFFSELRGEKTDESEINQWAHRFSIIMKEMLCDRSLLISPVVDFIEKESGHFPMHIVSGSDQTELRFLCKELEISHFFKSINGSPTPKKKLVQKLLHDNNFHRQQVLLIGDSVNDFEAAKESSIYFFGINNEKIRHLGDQYLEDVSDIEKSWETTHC